MNMAATKMRPFAIVVLLGIVGPLPAYAETTQPSRVQGTTTPDGGAQGYRPVYQTHFQSEIDPGLMLQQPHAGAMQLAASACQPSQRALRISIKKQDDYSRVANGVPRAEVSFAPRLNFQTGREYLIHWSTCLPADFQFDAQQPEGITQIHEGPNRGSPPFGITLNRSRYEVQLRDGNRVVLSQDLGSAASDKGRWVHWTLRYRPDSSGTNAITELDKDGARVLSASGRPNAYPNDDRGSFKIGIYKWWWKERPSDVSERTMFFGDVVVEVK